MCAQRKFDYNFYIILDILSLMFYKNAQILHYIYVTMLDINIVHLNIFPLQQLGYINFNDLFII